MFTLLPIYHLASEPRNLKLILSLGYHRPPRINNESITQHSWTMKLSYHVSASIDSASSLVVGANINPLHDWQTSSAAEKFTAMGYL